MYVNNPITKISAHFQQAQGRTYSLREKNSCVTASNELLWDQLHSVDSQGSLVHFPTEYRLISQGTLVHLFPHSYDLTLYFIYFNNLVIFSFS